MECYCTPSIDNCGANRRKKCHRTASHCLLSLRWENESNRYVEHIQDCWSWSPDDPECPSEPGVCYLLSKSTEKFTTCCCKGPLCNGIHNNTIISPPNQFNKSLITTGLPPFSSTPSPSLHVQHKDISLALIITIPIIAGLILMLTFACIVFYLPRYRVCRLKQSMRFPRKQKTCSHCKKSSSLTFNPFHGLSVCTCGHSVKDVISDESVAQNDYFGLNKMSKNPITGLQWLSNECVELCSVVKKVELKAHGRFGQVWLGRFSLPVDSQKNSIPNPSMSSLDKNNKEVDVAIKIFTSTEKRSWEAEVAIFNVSGLEHINILKYYGADQVVVDNSVGEDKLEYWLITEYHHLGSVYDYLHVYDIQWADLLKICIGISQGLAHLHMEIPNLSKPSIAHRDLNSRNILLKADLTACIADFGLAIRFEAGQCMRDAHLQLGTRRYMAPEVLDGAIQFSKDAFLRIDVYAMGLVFWELMMRCCCGFNKTSIIDITNYLAPFELELGPQPSMEGLQRWVAHAKQRPKFNPQWASDVGLCTLWETVEECWDQDAEARLSAGCVAKRLTLLLHQSTILQQINEKNVNTYNSNSSGGDNGKNSTNPINNVCCPISTSNDNHKKADSGHPISSSSSSSSSSHLYSKNVSNTRDMTFWNHSSVFNNVNGTTIPNSTVANNTTHLSRIGLPHSLNDAVFSSTVHDKLNDGVNMKAIQQTKEDDTKVGLQQNRQEMNEECTEHQKLLYPTASNLH